MFPTETESYKLLGERIAASDTLYGECFNVIGDGFTDNTLALNNAVKQAAESHSILKLNGGVYIYDTLNIPSNGVVIGEGMGITILKRKSISRLVGISISGSRSTVKNISTVGVWNLMYPKVRTFDINISIDNSGTSDVVLENVESSNAHIGFLMGGIIGKKSYINQRNVLFNNCFAHDTFDNNFSIAGHDSVNTGMKTWLKNCVAKNSFGSANYEIRFQTDIKIENCKASGARDTKLGAGLRFEESSNAFVMNFRSDSCYFGIQLTHNSSKIRIINSLIKYTVYGILLRSTANVELRNINIDSTASYGIRIETEKGWSFTNKDIKIVNGRILNSGRGNYYGYQTKASGIMIADDEFNVLNAENLIVDSLEIKNSTSGGIRIQSSKNFLIKNTILIDNGSDEGSYGYGILVEQSGTGKAQASISPTGTIDNVTFDNSGLQPAPVLLNLSEAAKKNIIIKSVFYKNRN